MPMFKFRLQDAPTTPVEQHEGVDKGTPRTPSSISSPSSVASSPGSHDSGLKGNGRYNRRRRTRGTLRNTEKRPYHSPTHVSPPHDKPMTKNDIYFALDCEMVGVGPEGLDSAVARVTICNWADQAILDTYVKVPVKVTDYRTFVSGIEAKDLESDKALTLSEVQKMVKDILHGKILIGHALENDLAALQITHPWHDIRDSANYPPFMKKGDKDKSVLRPRKLKELVSDKLGRDIQTLGEAHDPIEDATSAMQLYKTVRMDWEKLVMKQVASARVKEGRESEPSGRSSPSSPHGNNNSNRYRRPNSTVGNAQVGVAQRGHGNMNYSHSMYSRSRSAPLPTHYQGYGHQHQAYYPPQSYLY